MKTISYIVMVAAVLALGFTIGRTVEMSSSKYSLRQYTGVGSGVFKHGTIVKVENGNPTVIGHFDDDSGKTVAGTVELVKQ